MPLLLPRSVYHALRAHGEEAYPEECCGALLGRPAGEGWEIVDAVRAQNASTAPARSHYEIAAAELVGIAREARRQGLEIAGFYHSHPDARAQWSLTDLSEAHWIGASYVITEVVRGKAGETRSFRLAGTTEENKRFEAEMIELAGK
jgi:proteasome lid subunit RPN8/RPN11